MIVSLVLGLGYRSEDWKSISGSPKTLSLRFTYPKFDKIAQIMEVNSVSRLCLEKHIKLSVPFVKNVDSNCCW